MQIEVGNIIKLKKQHPCGSYDWEVVRTGQDIKIKCMGCGHLLMLARTKLEKSIREIKDTTSPQS